MNNSSALEKNVGNKRGSIVIQDYAPLYFPQLYRLLSDVYNSDITEAELETNYCGEDRQIILAIQDSNTVGCAFLNYINDYIRKRKTVFVTYVAVDTEFRHQGIGTKLFDEIEKRARNKACDAIELTSADFRTDAHAFYYSINFTRKKTTVFIKEMN